MTFLIIISYLIGAIPSGFILCKLIKGIDLREVGSCNPGATNAFRNAGWKVGISAFILDILKGYICVVLPLYKGFSLHPDLVWIQILCGMTAVIGHNWTLFLKFKGGKGVATSCGLFFGLCPQAAGISLLIWALITYFSGYVSLASIIAALFLPFWVWFFNSSIQIVIFSAIAGILIVVMHHKNIKRLFNGTENRFKTRKGISDKKDEGEKE